MPRVVIDGKWPTQQTTAILTQAAAVQNTWYTVLDTVYDVEVLWCVETMQSLAENVEVRWTIDGLTFTGGQAGAVAGTPYWLYHATTADAVSYSTAFYNSGYYTSLKCRSFKMEVRKTSANGANRLDGYCVYGKVDR